MPMRKIASTDDYQAIIHVDQIPPPGVKHQIEVMGNSGNSVLQGYLISPPSEKTVSEDNAVAASSSRTVIETEECSNKLLSISGGMLASTAAGGGSGSSSSSGYTPQFDRVTFNINASNPTQN